jgi:hypothetical protein
MTLWDCLCTNGAIPGSSLCKETTVTRQINDYNNWLIFK